MFSVNDIEKEIHSVFCQTFYCILFTKKEKKDIYLNIFSQIIIVVNSKLTTD